MFNFCRPQLCTGTCVHFVCQPSWGVTSASKSKNTAKLHHFKHVFSSSLPHHGGMRFKSKHASRPIVAWAANMLIPPDTPYFAPCGAPILGSGGLRGLSWSWLPDTWLGVQATVKLAMQETKRTWRLSQSLCSRKRHVRAKT